MSAVQILLIEDHRDDAELTCLALKRCGFEDGLLHFLDGQRALQFLFCEGEYQGRDPEELPRLILLDLNLPRFNGFQVLEQIRANSRTHWIPVIILSSSNQERDIIRAYDLGASGYIHKVIDYRQFNELIRALALFWMTMNETPGHRRRAL